MICSSRWGGRTAGCLWHLYALRGISSAEFYPEDLCSFKWRQAAPSRRMQKQQGIQPELHIPSRQQKLVFLPFPLLWSHREALNNEYQDAGKHLCSLQIKTYLKKSLSLDSRLQIFSSCFATYKTSSLSESRSCIAFPLGRVLGLSATSWCHFSRRPRKPAAILPSWANTGTSWYGKMTKSEGQLFPCPSLAFCLGHDEDKLQAYMQLWAGKKFSVHQCMTRTQVKQAVRLHRQ